MGKRIRADFDRLVEHLVAKLIRNVVEVKFDGGLILRDREKGEELRIEGSEVVLIKNSRYRYTFVKDSDTHFVVEKEEW